MQIAISGCGIAGAACGFLLAENGHDVTIFEQAERCRPVGAGIMLQASGQRVLGEFGMLERVAGVSARLRGLTAMRSDGRTLVRLDLSRLDPSIFAMGVHRGKLFEMLLERCRHSGATICNNTRVESWNADQGVVRLSDGGQHSGFDFLIAADGSRSLLRESSGIRSRVKQYRYGALWVTGKCDFQPDHLYQVVGGTTQMTGLLPIGQGQASFFWGLRASQWDELRNSSFELWREQVIEFCPQSASLLHRLDSFNDLVFATYRNVSMQRWHSDRILFLGDAAHASSPHLGQGVNLALEDVLEFCRLFNETGDFEIAAAGYTRMRRSKLRFYQRLTRMLTPFFQSDGNLKGIARNLALPWLPHLPYIGNEMLRTLSGNKNGWFG